MYRCSLLIASSPAMAETWLVGTWKLMEVTQTEGGTTKPYMGAQPLGQVMFDTNGHLSNILMRGDIAKFKANNRLDGSADENAAVVHGSIAYFGTYVQDGDTLKLHVLGSTYPNWSGTDQTRSVHRNGDQLVWENATASAGGSVKQVYERVK